MITPAKLHFRPVASLRPRSDDLTTWTWDDQRSSFFIFRQLDDFINFNGNRSQYLVERLDIIESNRIDRDWNSSLLVCVMSIC